MVIGNVWEDLAGKYQISKVLLIDFGSMDKEPGKKRKSSLGTSHFFAPELDKEASEVAYSHKSDVAALGISLSELTGLMDLPRLKLFFRRSKHNAEYAQLTTEIKGLVDAMRKDDPDERPSADLILTSFAAIFKSGNFEEFLTDEIKQLLDRELPDFSRLHIEDSSLDGPD